MICLFYGKGLELSNSVVMVITINYFIQFMRKAVLLFRDATGTFYQDRWKPFFEGILNLVLSVLFEKLIGVTGVIVATIITNLLICHIIEPHILFKYALHKPVRKFYVKNYGYILVFVIVLLLLDKVLVAFENCLVEMIVNAGFSILFSMVFISALMLVNKNMQAYVKSMFNKIRFKSGGKP